MDQFDISTLPEIAASRPLPFRESQRCPKCGNRERRGWFWALLNRMNMIQKAYCMGNQPATVEVQTPDGKTREAPTLCASLRREHLHLRCPLCGYGFMSEVKHRA